MDLRAVIHSSEFGPAFLSQGRATILEFQDDEPVVVAAGLVGVYRQAKLRVDGRDLGLSHHPTEELNRVATHVEGHASAGAVHVPEMRGVGPVVLFALLEQDWFPQGAFVKELFQADVLGGEAQFLRVHEFDSGPGASLNHLVRLPQVEAKRLLTDHVLARGCGVHRGLTVQVVRDTDDDHIDLVHLQELAVVCEMVRDAVLGREIAGVALRR